MTEENRFEEQYESIIKACKKGLKARKALEKELQDYLEESRKNPGCAKLTPYPIILKHVEEERERIQAEVRAPIDALVGLLEAEKESVRNTHLNRHTLSKQRHHEEMRSKNFEIRYNNRHKNMVIAGILFVLLISSALNVIQGIYF